MALISVHHNDQEVYSVQGKIELFPQKGGWHYVRVPEEYTQKTRAYSDRGLVAITASVGKSTWKTSLLPYGDGTHFIALPAKIREAEQLQRGDDISLTFSLRER